MDYPDWYPEWRHEAFHALQEKNAALSETYKLGSWPRYDHDLEAGTLIFSDQGVPKVVAEVQIVGTTSTKAGDWLWAWGNNHWPESRIVDALAVRTFGEEHGIEELVHDYLSDEDLNVLGWEMTAVAARITNALGAYRPKRDEGGGLFLLYRSIRWRTDRECNRQPAAASLADPSERKAYRAAISGAYRFGRARL